MRTGLEGTALAAGRAATRGGAQMLVLQVKWDCVSLSPARAPLLT